ncbi:hypothetical protein K435DRAFT_893328, partial [Dendrothele bispora CBS 962.96]
MKLLTPWVPWLIVVWPTKGIFVPIFYQSLSITRCHPQKKYRFAFHCLLMISSTGVIVCMIGVYLQYLSFARTPIHGNVPSWKQRLASSVVSATPYLVALDWCTMTNLFIGDAIIAWRAYILWSHSIAVRSLLCILLAGSAGVYLYFGIDFAMGVFSDSSESNGKEASNTMSATAAAGFAVFLSFGLNFCSTSLILVRAWQFRQSMKELFLQSNRSLAYQILLLFIECGFLFGAYQLATGILTVSSTASDPTSSSISSRGLIYFVFTGMHPFIA